MTQVERMILAGKKCKAEYPHRQPGGQVYDDLPISCLDKHGKPTTKTAKKLIAAWNIGFDGGDGQVDSKKN